MLASPHKGKQAKRSCRHNIRSSNHKPVAVTACGNACSTYLCQWRLQGDLWQWFLEPSLYGTDILTMGGSRGPSVSYYVPYLSAMQLLLPVLPQPPQQQPGTPSAAVADEAVEASQHTQQSTAQEAENPAAAEQTQASADVQSQPGGEAALPRAGKLYHVEDHWQQLSSQVFIILVQDPRNVHCGLLVMVIMQPLLRCGCGCSCLLHQLLQSLAAPCPWCSCTFA